MKRHTDICTLGRMLGELGSLAPVMLVTILCGVGGYLAAAAIPALSAAAAVGLLGQRIILPISTAIPIILACAVLRGVLRYAEQLSGHYIAFKILAILRDKLFAKLRRLAPAKMDTVEKGSIISTITSDIEMMEVFYAHTIAPVIIAITTSVIYVTVLFYIHPAFALLAVFFYLLIGLVLPFTLQKSAAPAAAAYRRQLGEHSAFILDSMRGLREILLFGAGNTRKHTIGESSEAMSQRAWEMERRSGLGFAITDTLIIAAILGCILLGYLLYSGGAVDPGQMIVAVVLLASSFGPVAALSSLSTSLSGTIASARRVFDILDECPSVDDIPGQSEIDNSHIQYEGVSFSYPSRETQVLKDIDVIIPDRHNIAIVGGSGSGKSTMLKLLMRFYDTDTGETRIGGDAVRQIPTQSLRRIQAFVSQDAYLFNDTIENNIRMGNDEAAMQEIIAAAQKAAIHDTIERLPHGYQTYAGEIGSRFSSGERQRIALARAFLRSSRILLLDEPTSNLDTLNEAMILKSIRTHSEEQTVILVSHRPTTAGICEHVIQIENGRLIMYEAASFHDIHKS